MSDLENDPREQHEEETSTPTASPWRTEPWRGRYLVVREVPHGDGILKREVDAPNPFSAFANIYEDEDAAEARAEQLNKESANDQVQGKTD